MVGLEASGSFYAVNQGWLPVVPGLGFLAKCTGKAKASHYLFGVYGSLRDFKKVCSVVPGRQLVWISLRKLFWPGKVSENHQSMTRAMLAWLMETQTGHPPVLADCVGAGLNKRKMAPAGTLVLPSLSLKPANSVPSHKSLLSLCWNFVQVFVRESLCGDPLKGCLGFQKPLLHPDGIPADFHSQLLWGLLFLALSVWAGESNLGLEPLTPLGDLGSRYPSLFLTTVHRCGTIPFCVSISPISLIYLYVSFLISLL